MAAFLYSLIAWAASGLVQTVLVGAGMTLVVFAGLNPLVESFLNDAVSNLNILPQSAIQLLLLCGVGESLTITGSAILSRIALDIAAKSFSLSFKSN